MSCHQLKVRLLMFLRTSAGCNTVLAVALKIHALISTANEGATSLMTLCTFLLREVLYYKRIVEIILRIQYYIILM